MKILVTGTAGFIGDEVVGVDNINDYYDVNLKYGRLKELGIDKDEVESNDLPLKIHHSKLYENHSFYKVDLADKEAMEQLFKTEKFDAVCNLVAQAGGRETLNNLYQAIAKGLKEQLPELEIKEPIYRDFRAGDIRHSNANIDKARELLEYEPTHTLEQGLKESIAWYINDIKGNK